MAECNQVYVGKVYDEPGEARDAIRETSASARHTVAEVSRGNQFNAVQSDAASRDRANQDRYLAGEFRGVAVGLAEGFGRVSKDLCDAHDNITTALCDGFSSLAKDVERNGRSAELATEKTGAATILAIEKTAAAAALAMANCCCEIKEKIAADGERTRALVSQIDRERLQARLAVLEARTVS